MAVSRFDPLVLVVGCETPPPSHRAPPPNPPPQWQVQRATPGRQRPLLPAGSDFKELSESRRVLLLRGSGRCQAHVCEGAAFSLVKKGIEMHQRPQCSVACYDTCLANLILSPFAPRLSRLPPTLTAFLRAFPLFPAGRVEPPWGAAGPARGWQGAGPFGAGAIQRLRRVEGLRPYRRAAAPSRRLRYALAPRRLSRAPFR